MKTITFLLLLLPTLHVAQTDSLKVPSTFAISISQDNAFGFYPAVFGSFGLDDQVSLTYYGQFWTNPSYGNLVAGTDTWLEAGIGLSFTLAEGRLFVNPSIGTTHGTLLSDAQDSKIMEGLVPSITSTFVDDRFEVDFFFAYYKALQNEGPNSGDYLLYWLLPGFKATPKLSLGLHYESFVLSRVSEGEAGTLYQVFGGYLKFTTGERYTLRFTAGVNSQDEGVYSDQFYKLSVFIPMM